MLTMIIENCSIPRSKCAQRRKDVFTHIPVIVERLDLVAL